MAIVEGIADWVERIAAVPVVGPLRERTVVVPSEAMAHALRRELARAERTPFLVGTRFLTAASAAREVLHAAGVAFRDGEDAFRVARLGAFFRSSEASSLRYFVPTLLATRPGWDAAFARTIGDLEKAGMTPSEVAAHATTGRDLRLADIALVWSALERSAGDSLSQAAILARAASVLAVDPERRWPFRGPVLAVVTGHEAAVHARFLRTLPAAHLALARAHPLRRSHAERVERLYGVAPTSEAAPTPSHDAKERDLLARFLFEDPGVLGDPARARSAGPDGSVHLEEHAGVDEEIEAAVTWVAREVFEYGTPLEEIAVLVPTRDPLAGMLHDRIATLPWPASEGGASPVHVMGGLDVARSAAGARLLAVVRALRSHLHVTSLLELAPALRTGGGSHVSRSAAAQLLSSLGTIGGTPAHPRGALDWTLRLAARKARIERELARSDAGDDENDPARSRERLAKQLSTLDALLPPIEALTSVAGALLDGASMASLWPKLAHFLDEWLLAPGDGARSVKQALAALEELTADPAVGSIVGDAALDLLEHALASLRVSTCRFGEPAVTIATVDAAAGLPFRAVRVLGLAEGMLPRSVREDPVLPDAARERLAAATRFDVPRAADRMLAQLHALHRAVSGASERVVLSASRMDLDRTYREPSAVLLEAAAALGRPDRADPTKVAVIPDARAIRRDAFDPAREALAAFRARVPLTEAAHQDGAALRAAVPASWTNGGVCDVAAARALLRHDAVHGSLDGVFGDCAFPVLPGLAPDRPLSASALQTLLGCPHRFLFERVLRWRAPEDGPDGASIEALPYGSLFHEIAETFYGEHGDAFGLRAHDLAHWKRKADAIVEAAFAAFLESYPLVGPAIREVQHARLRRDMHALLAHDWEGPGRKFVAVERPFGCDEPLLVTVGKHSVYLRGYIDRIDVDAGATYVRDLKTGRAHPRKEGEVDPTFDIQLGVYGIVAKELHRAWGTPSRLRGAYVYPADRGERERAFDDDFDALVEAARAWLATGVALLRERSFPRTPNEADCRFCSFDPVCGARERARATALVEEGASAAMKRFRVFKSGGDDAPAKGKA